VLTGPKGSATPKALLEEAYRRALKQGNWNVVRRCAGSLGLVHPQLEDALTDLLVRQKQVVVGRNYTNDSLITQPTGSLAIAAMIQRYSGEDGREWVLQQELLLALDGLARRDPNLLSGSLTLQLGQLLLLLTSELASERNLAPSEAFEALCDQPPHSIGRRLQQVLSDVEHAKAALQRKEQLHLSGRVSWEAPEPLEELNKSGDWLKHRERNGCASKRPPELPPRHLEPAAPLPRPGDRRQARAYATALKAPPCSMRRPRGSATSPSTSSTCSARSKLRNTAGSASRPWSP